MISRFMLNLQAANRASAHASSSGDVDSIVFNRVVGSLGASISPDHFIADDSEDDDDGDGLYSTEVLAAHPQENGEPRSEGDLEESVA